MFGFETAPSTGGKQAVNDSFQAVALLHQRASFVGSQVNQYTTYRVNSVKKYRFDLESETFLLLHMTGNQHTIYFLILANIWGSLYKKTAQEHG